MSGELTNSLPVESDSQRIGRLASKCFEANSPTSWASKPIDGDSDFGYDFQVQVLANGLAKDIFRAQLKGTTVPELIADGTAYSLEIKVSTANYYARATEPVLLVLCDLSVDPAVPKNCPLYYLWIHDELRRLRETGIRDGQRQVTLHVPKANRLDDTTNLSADIEQYRALSRIGHNLDRIVEGKKPTLATPDRIEMTTKIVHNLDSKSVGLLDALADDTESSWIEAPSGSLQWHLREAMTALQSGVGDDCKGALSEASKLLDNSKSLEKADYWNTVGRLHNFNLDDTAAREAFDKACKLSGDAERHLIPWAEAELRVSFREDVKADFSTAIARLSSTKPAIAGMRARLTAAEGKFENALAITEGINGIDKYITRAIIFSMLARWDESIAECDGGLSAKPLRAAQKQLFTTLRARANYSKAIGPIDFGDKDSVYLPAPGPSGTNISLLRAAWKDIAEVITALRATGWPGNVELLSDMWSSTATMLGLEEEALPLMAEAARKRPTLKTLQAGLESMAAQAGEFEIALEANLRQPESLRSLQQRVALLHMTKRHHDCVKLLEEKWSAVADDSVIFGFALLQGIYSAEKIIRSDLAIRWKTELESRPALAGHAALFEFYETKIKKPLEQDGALDTLIEKFESLGRPPLIAKHLLKEIDGTDRKQAELCIKIVNVVKAASMLKFEDLTRLAQALTTLGKWDELLLLSQEGLNQFTSNERLLAIGAIALDKLGRTSEAHELLKSIVEKADADDLALNIYIRIASRSGFTEQALTAVEKVFSGEKDHAKQLECLRHLFVLLHQTDPTQSRLVDIAWKIGEMVNQEDEIQEGMFLTTMFTATIPASNQLETNMRDAFQRRLAAFTSRFPNSKILRSVALPSDASGDEIISILDEVIGVDEEHRKLREKLLRELNLGITPVPYAWRPKNFLDSASELPTLWEISKHSSWDARHLHLTMATNDWKSIGLAKMRDQVPLLDLLSLLVLSDLDLLELLFKVFPKIAIGKATMMALQKLLGPLSSNLCRNKLLPIQEVLKSHFANIEQPETDPPSEEEFIKAHWNSLEIIKIAKGGKYLIYSDDAMFRIYSQQPSICTLDLLFALDEMGQLSAREAAIKIAILCSWRVGLVITPRYQLAILPDMLGAAKSLNQGVNAIMNDEHSNALFSAIWNPEKRFQDILGHGGITLRNLVENDQNDVISIAAIAGYWLGKARLHKEAPTPTDRVAAFLIIQAIIPDRPLSEGAARRLWSIFNYLIEYSHGNFMDNDKYRQSHRVMGEIAAESDKHHLFDRDNSLCVKLSAGLTKGTGEYDWFSNAYTSKLLDLALK